MTSLEDEFLEALRRVNSPSAIGVLPSSDSFFRLLSDRFPVRGSGIEWSRVPGARRQAAASSESDAFLDDSISFAHHTFCAEGITSEQTIIVAGDSVIDSALSMTVRTLLENLRLILELPQHTYVLPPDASWCMAFTFEGDLHFGHAALSGPPRRSSFPLS